MSKIKWPDAKFEEKVKLLIREHLHPLASECKKEEDVLALWVAFVTKSIGMIHYFGYDKKEIDARLLLTIDAFMLDLHTRQQERFDTVH